MNKIVDFNSGLQENITSILNVEEVKNDIENINFAVESKNKNQMEKTHLMMDGKYSSYIPDFGKSMYCYNKNMGFIYDSLDEESLEHNLMLMMARLQGYLINEIKNNISSALQNSINLNIPITNEVNINISFNQVKEKIEKMPGLTYEETENIKNKIDELESISKEKVSKKKKWEKVKPILIFAIDKGADIAIEIMLLI